MSNDLYAPIAKEEKDQAVNLTVRVPLSMREAFSKHCTDRGLEVSVVMRRFIERELAAK